METPVGRPLVYSPLASEDRSPCLMEASRRPQQGEPLCKPLSMEQLEALRLTRLAQLEAQQRAEQEAQRAAEVEGKKLADLEARHATDPFSISQSRLEAQRRKARAATIKAAREPPLEPCKFDGCTKWPQRRGLCAKHGGTHDYNAPYPRGGCQYKGENGSLCRMHALVELRRDVGVRSMPVATLG